MAKDVQHAEQQPTLTEALGFTEGDLAANRDGRLSERQQQQVRSLVGRGWVSAIGLSLVLAGVGFWVFVVWVWWVAAIAWALAGGLLWLNRSGRGPLLDEARAGVVSRVEGVATLTADTIYRAEGQRMEFVVTVEDEAFVVSRKTLMAFDDGAAYTIYFLPGSRLLVAAEPSLAQS